MMEPAAVHTGSEQHAFGRVGVRKTDIRVAADAETVGKGQAGFLTGVHVGAIIINNKRSCLRGGV